ncbi:uncharacterized protein LOC117337738 [Pecten maximus]|uniref:uncharacterized protein LOC117337738 n=1 Tax=Pecten maximus TaxID=6579 RepID=UPI0014584281|nr:uncharacterized protein LOC117337738 [Pecten maximus]
MQIFAIVLAVLYDWIPLSSGNGLDSETPPSVAAALVYPQQALLGDIVTPECWNFTNGDRLRAEFYSPNYPEEYPNDIECTQYLEAQPGYRIHVDFRGSFSVEKSEKCKYDFLEFRDGPFSYSPLIGKYCGKEFPPLIRSTTRFIWIRFKSDKNLGDKGFKAIYSFVKKQDYNPKREDANVCRTLVNTIDPDGILKSSDFSIHNDDGGQRQGHRDCTWEVHAQPGSKIRLSHVSAWFPFPQDCGANYIEIYDKTTASSDRIFHYCNGPLPEFVSVSSRVFIRLYGNQQESLPRIEVQYSVYRKGVTGYSSSSDDKCASPGEFFCDKWCISSGLVCNGRSNCPHGEDEQHCKQEVVAEVKEIPLHMIILGAVVGVIGTGLLIGGCLTWRAKRQQKRKDKEAQLQQAKLKDTNMEMTSNSSSTTLSSKKGGSYPPPYYSLPRPHVKNQGMNREYTHRNSLTNSLQSPSEGEYPDQNSDPGNYKKYMVMDQYMEEDSSPCPSVYNQGPPVLTTIVERHDIPPHTPDIDPTYGWGGYGWRQPRSEPRSPMSPPTLSENIAKLKQYTIPKNQQGYQPENKMYNPETRYEIYPETKFQIGKEFKMKYGMMPDTEMMLEQQRLGKEFTAKYGTQSDDMEKQKMKQFKMRSQHPDITRDIEVT